MDEEQEEEQEKDEEEEEEENEKVAQDQWKEVYIERSFQQQYT